MFSVSFSVSNLAEWTPITTSSFGIGLLQLLQLGQDVHAVDAAVGPEVEQHELAAEVGEGERLGGIDPFDAAGDFGGVEPAGIGVFRLFGSYILRF